MLPRAELKGKDPEAFPWYTFLRLLPHFGNATGQRGVDDLTLLEIDAGEEARSVGLQPLAPSANARIKM